VVHRTSCREAFDDGGRHFTFLVGLEDLEDDLLLFFVPPIAQGHPLLLLARKPKEPHQGYLGPAVWAFAADRPSPYVNQ